MTRVSLSRLPGDRVLVVDGDVEREVAVADLPAYVRAREVDAPRWVWDDTARWYPPLLAAGVRVERCHDLRLGHHLLRRAPAVDVRLLEGEQSEHWDRLGPSTPSDPALFSVDDTAEHLRADLEDARQLAAVAASTEAARLGLLLAAESSGALVAVEMTYAGVPWRVDVHERLLTDLLGPRPPRGARPQGLEALVAEVRGAFGAPGLNPDSRPELLAALRRAGLDVSDTRASSLRALEHPGIVPLLRYKQLAHLFQTNGWAWIDAVGERRPVPAVVPAGRLRHRPVVVQRRRGAVVPGAGPARGRGRRRLDVRGRRRRPARAARARRHERRPRAGQVGTRRRPLPGDGRRRRGGQPQGRQARPARRDVRRHQRRERPDGRRAHPALPRRLRTRRGGGPCRRARPGGAHAAGARVAEPGRRVGPRPRRPAGRSRQPGPPTGARTAASPATSSCRAPAPSGRCAGSPTCATGSGAWARPAPSSPDRTWSSSSTTRSSCTPRPLSPTRSPRRPPRRRRPQRACCSATSAIDFPLNISIVRSYADAGKPGAAVES